MMPMMSSANSLKSAAHFCESWKVSTPPNLVVVSSSMMGEMFVFSKAANKSARHSPTNLSGKNSRLPIMTPIVILPLLFFMFVCCDDQFNFMVAENLPVFFFEVRIGDDIVDEGKCAKTRQCCFANFGGISNE